MNRKLVREMWRMRGQLVSIALVVAAGIMTIVTLRGTYESLAWSLDRFYRDYRFADVFAELSRAPEQTVSRIERIPGVAHVSTRVTRMVNLDVPGLPEPAVGLMLSLPTAGTVALNEIHLISGRLPEAYATDQVLVSESFALANGLHPGSTLGAVINGRRRALMIVGVAISPDFIGELAPGAIFPDDRRFGILRMDRHALSALTGMEAAFNEVSVALTRDGSEAAVIADLDRVLAPFGGRGAYGRRLHSSHATVIGELEQNRVTGTIIPAIFLGVAAFLLNIVIGRIVATQRNEIALLKAFGYGNAAIGRHYLGFALSVVLTGSLIGTGTGVWLGAAFTDLYGQFFRFPALSYGASPQLLLVAVLVSVVAGVAGALGAVRTAVRLPPADALRPDSPAGYRRGSLERLGAVRALPLSARMIARNIERRPVRAGLSVLGVALAVAILVVSMFFRDAVERMVDVQFGEIQREDLAVYFNDERPASIRRELGRLDGVSRVELFRAAPVRITNAQHQRTVVLTGVDRDAALRRIVDQAHGPVTIRTGGVTLTDALADRLGVASGDTVQVALLEGRRSVHAVPVVATVSELFGLNAYMEFNELQQILGGVPLATGAYLGVEMSARARVNRTVKDLPAVLSAYSPAALRATFEEQMNENLLLSVTFLVSLAGILAVGVIYNGARIALSERGRELASLRVLGFSRREVTTILLGEQALVTAAAIPLGWVTGIGLGAAILTLFDMERYRIPMVITPQTCIYSALIAVVAALLSGLAIRHRIDRLDLIAVLKTRE